MQAHFSSRSPRRCLVDGETRSRQRPGSAVAAAEWRARETGCLPLAEQACSRLRVAGGRFLCPEFGNKAAQAQRGVVGAASGSGSTLWVRGLVCLGVDGSGCCFYCQDLESPSTEPRSGDRQCGQACPARAARRAVSEQNRRAGGLLCKQVSEANTARGNVVTGCRRSAAGGSKRVLA